MSRRVRILICCVLVLFAFGAGALAYAHTYGNKLGKANAEGTLETEFLVDKNGKIEVPKGPNSGNVNTRGTEDNPFFILEIVPYSGMAQVGYLIDGQEPIDVHAAARDGVEFPGIDHFYNVASGVQYRFWMDEVPSTFSWNNAIMINEYGELTRVEDGTGTHKRVEFTKDGRNLVRYEKAEKGNYTWEPSLSLDECIALSKADSELTEEQKETKAEYNEAVDPDAAVGTKTKTYSAKEYVIGYGKKVEHKNVFLKESIGLAYDFDESGVRYALAESVVNERVRDYVTEVYTVTPEDLNLNPELVDRADLIVISTMAGMVPTPEGASGEGVGMYIETEGGESLTDPESGKVRTKYKFVPYVRKDKFGYEDPSGQYGRKLNVLGATYNTNRLDWEVALRIYENCTDPNGACPVVADYDFYDTTKSDLAKKVQLTKKASNGKTKDATEENGTQNNMTKLFFMLYQMENHVFELFHGEVTSAKHPKFEAVPMLDGEGKEILLKDGKTKLMTGKFLYDKDWTSGTVKDANSRIYWNQYTLLPWHLVEEGKLSSLSDYGAVMAKYEIMIGGATYNMTQYNDDMRRAYLHYDGDTSLNTGFDSTSSGMVDDAKYGIEVYDYFDKINGSAARPSASDITMADCLNYLLNIHKDPFPTVNYKQYKILELQPSSSYKSIDEFWTPLFVMELNAVNKPEVDQMTTSEFIGSHVECIDEYDLIYIGMNKLSSDLMMDFNYFKGKNGAETDYSTNFVYAHTGPKVAITDSFKALYGWLGSNTKDKEKYFTFSGNDLTKLALTKLQDFDKAGLPIMYGDGFFTDTSASTMATTIDRKSNIYTLGKSTTNKLYEPLITGGDEAEMTKFKDYLVLSSLKVKMVFESEDDYPILYDSSKSEAQRYINGLSDSNRTLKYKFTVDAPAGTTYDVKLYVDANTDGLYTEELEDVGAVVYSTDAEGNQSSSIKSGKVEAGKTYIVKRVVDDRIGSVCWKLDLVGTVGGSKKVVASMSGVSAIKANSSEVEEIRVLQIAPSTDKECTLFLPTQKDIEKGHLKGASKAFAEKIQNINGMKITFDRMTQEEILRYINGYVGEIEVPVEGGGIASTTKTVTFKDMPETEKWGKFATIKDGKATFTFKKQYDQSFFKLPTGVDSKKLLSVTINGVTGSEYGIRLLTEAQYKDYTGDEGIVVYNNTTVETGGADIKYFVIIGLNPDASEATPQVLKIDSVTFTLKGDGGPGAKPAETKKETVTIPANPNYLDDTYDMLVLGFSDTYNGVSDATLIAKIKEFIDLGKAVLYSHDTSSGIGNEGTNSLPVWGKTVTESFREMFGMDRYGAMNNIKAGSITREVDVPYIPATSASSTDKYTNGSGQELIQGASNGILFRSLYPTMGKSGYNEDGDANVNSTKVSRVNQGAITQYPYTIPEQITVSTTHPQYYQLDMENEDIVVWYCLDGGSGGDAYENDYYGSSKNDVRNNYYIYNKGNVTYSGLGHVLDNEGEVVMDPREIELFVNTFVAAYRASAKPVKVEVVNMDATSDVYGNQYLCVDVDSADPDEIIGTESNGIQDGYMLQVADDDGEGYEPAAPAAEDQKKSKRVYFRLKDNNSYGANYDVKILWNNGVETNGIKIDGESKMFAVYKEDGTFVDTESVKYKSNTEIYYVDVPITLESATVGEVVGTTELKVVVTMNYKIGEKEFTKDGETVISIMPRGLFNLD